MCKQELLFGWPIAALIVGIGVFHGCDNEEGSASSDPTQSTESTVSQEQGAQVAETPTPTAALPPIALDEAQTAKAQELTGQAARGSFPSSETTGKENARVFLHLAATADDANVLVASLRAMSSTFTHDERRVERAEMVSPQYHAVVLARLSHEDGKVQAAALEAASHSLMGDGASAEVIAKVLDMAENHTKPEGRYAALSALGTARDVFSSDKSQMRVFLKALDAEQPWLVSEALFRLNSLTSYVEDRPATITKLLGLMRHADPGVRGRAAQTLGGLAKMEPSMTEQSGQALIALLDDENPYAKSEACSALSWMHFEPAVHKIITLVDDMSSNTYDITGWTKLDGSTGRLHHDGSAWSRVNDAALRALDNFSRRGDERFEHTVSVGTVEEDLRASATKAKAWYNRHRTEFAGVTS